MVTYVVLISLTDQGIRTIKDSLNRAETVMEMAKVLLYVGSQGNVRTTAMKAFDVAEYGKILSELPA